MEKGLETLTALETEKECNGDYNGICELSAIVLYMNMFGPYGMFVCVIHYAVLSSKRYAAYLDIFLIATQDTRL